MPRSFLRGLFLLLFLAMLTGCSEPHTCGDPCGQCGLCLNASCAEPECSEKCPGHHSCTQVCDQCGLCLNSVCQETVCSEKCTGHHSCTQICVQCGLCLNESCPEDVCSEKCAGHQQQVYDFYSSGYITADAVSLNAGKLVFDIQPGIWVPGHLQDTALAMQQAMEAVSGLSFDGNGSSSRFFPDGKVHASFSRDMLYTQQDWYQGLSTSEIGSAWASSFSHAELSPGDLYITDVPAVTHELGHVLSYRQTEWSFCQLLSEGFTEYTDYLTRIAVSQSDPQLGFYLGNPQNSLLNMTIHDYRQLYAQPLEYWFENTFQYSANANYTIGFRFMAYLQDTYGDYSSWILKMEELYSFQTCSNGSDVPPVQYQIDALKAAYGEDVLDHFYPWLKAHEQDFVPTLDTTYRDLSNVEALNLYPNCSALSSSTGLTRFSYRDLYINLEPAKQYLSQYKQLDISGLMLEVSAPTKLELYQEDGTCISETCSGSISLEGISCIRLTGSGKLNYLKITGYEDCE